MKKLLVLATLISFNSLAADCMYSYDQNKSQVSWTAFKTPKKVGVNGKFSKFKLDTTASKNKLDVIKSAKFTIDSSSVDTGNPDRDKKIVNFFFTKNGKPITITGKVISVTETETKMLLELQGKSKEVTLKNTMTDEKVTLNGTIDVLEFGLDSNLQAINEACKALHEGKTWSDVNISIETQLTKTCKG